MSAVIAVSNAVLLAQAINLGLNAIAASTRSVQEINAALQKAAAEKRDVTDAEIQALRETNDLISHALIKQLSEPVNLLP